MNEQLCKSGQACELLIKHLLMTQYEADAVTKIIMGDLIEQACAIRSRLSILDRALVKEGRDGD